MTGSSSLDSFTKLIPGFGAYQSEQKRRDDDVAVRKYLASRLQECKRDLQAIVAPLVDQANFDAIKSGEKLRTAIETMQSRLRSAVEGYSSWFESSRVDEAKLKQVVALDNDLVGVIDRLQHEIGQISKTSPDFQESEAVVNELKERFSRRSDLLSK
jgi:predicted aminopeptidase